MSTEWQPNSSRRTLDADVDPAQVVQELGRSYEADLPPPPPSADATAYCSGCWSALPPGAAECPDCGASVAEMAAEQAARAEADARWEPPRAVEEEAAPSAEASPSVLEPGGVAPPAAARSTVPRPRRLTLPHHPWIEAHGRTLVQAGLVLGLLFGAAESGKWLAYATSPTLSTSATGDEAASPHTPARLHWRNSVADLRLELLSGTGHVVASCNGLATDEVYRLRPGSYQLKVRNQGGSWNGPTQTVQAKPGVPLLLGASKVSVAAYYVWSARRMLAGKDAKGARFALAKAVNSDPNNADARKLLGRIGSR